MDTGLFSPSLALLGGRYCSIQGRAAAQLRYGPGKAGDEKVTVFQVPLDDRFKHHLPVRRVVDGAQVEVMPVGELMVVRVASAGQSLPAITQPPTRHATTAFDHSSQAIQRSR
ncbi:MAG: hypothetical protein GKR94_04865 [Gammaproteobacteria bacterium]|nr:hypothetical protein [Gammaproteobacteria bacterium]